MVSSLRTQSLKSARDRKVDPMRRDEPMQREEQRRRPSLPLAALALASLLIPPPAHASFVDLVGMAHLDTWEAPAGRDVKTIRGLTLVEWLPDREVTLILLELEGDRRLVLSREHRELEGVSVLRLLLRGSEKHLS